MYVSRLSLSEMHSGGKATRQPDVVLSHQVPSMQVWPNTISNWDRLRLAVSMGSSPCSAGTKPLAVPNTLMHNELNYWAGRYVCMP